jgi:glycosyltransferase involved in cell wall biosynthesis
LVLDPPEFDPPELAQRYAAMDIFCYPSLAERGETFGVSVAEAMAAGAAPVVSNLACFNELVRDGETGLIFDHRGSGAEERLAHALARLLSDSALRGTIAQRAQEHVERYDYPRSARTLLEELARLVARERK